MTNVKADRYEITTAYGVTRTAYSLSLTQLREASRVEYWPDDGAACWVIKDRYQPCNVPAQILHRFQKSLRG